MIRNAICDSLKLEKLVSLCALLICLTLVGCRQESGPSAEDLVRQRQQRESARLSKAKTLDERLAIAEEHLANDDVHSAQQAIRPLLISNPRHPNVIIVSAKCEAAAGNLVAATEMLEAIDEDETDAKLYTEVLWLAAGWLDTANQFDQAQRKLERVLQLGGDLPRVRRKLVEILSKQGRAVEAADHFLELARSGEIREKELFAMNCYSDPVIDETIPKPDFSGELVPALLMQAKILRVDGKLARSRALVRRLAKEFPESTPISAFLGRVHADFHDDQQLGQWIESTPSGIEREAEYWHSLGDWMQQQGKDREAVRCYLETVKRDQTDRLAYAGLARSLNLLGEQEASTRVLDRFELIAETAMLAAKIGRERGSLDELNRMADLLHQLRRPWEALGWRAIALKLYGATPQQTDQLREQRELLAKANADDEQSRYEFLTCGIDVIHWPLPSSEIMSVSAADSSRPKPTASRRKVPLMLPDVATDVGLEFQYDNGEVPGEDRRYLHQLTGGGIGVIDVDLDGWSDLYFTQGGGDAFDPDGSKPNRMFRNLGGQKFVDTTNQTETGDLGYGQGVTVADINQDGFPDLVVANIGPNLLYLNNGDGSFAKRTLPSADHAQWTTSIACGDLDGDHLPEIFEVNYIDDPSVLDTPCTSDRCNPRRFRPAADTVWSVHADMSISSFGGCHELKAKPSYGFAAIIADFNGHPGNEVFVANDGKPNQYWVSQGDEDVVPRMLSERSRIHGCDAGVSGAIPGSMGVAYGDFDRNGMLDLHVTNFFKQPADLLLQNSGGLFSNSSISHNLSEDTIATVGWGTHAADFDRDGWLDLAVLNGSLIDHHDPARQYKMRPQLFRGGAEGFRTVTPNRTTGDYWGDSALGRTMAGLDFNGDARPDLVTNHLDVPVALLENRVDAGNSFRVELVGTVSERDATGSAVTVTCGDQVWTRWVVGGDGFLCNNDPVLDFGIGDAEKIEELVIHWACGDTQQFRDIAAGRQILIVEGTDEYFDRDRR